MKCKKAGSDAFLVLLDHRNTPPTGIQFSPAQRLLNRRTRSLLPMSAGLLRPSVADEDTTRTKLRLRQQQQARYYDRGARDLDPLEKGDPVRVKPWHVGKRNGRKALLRNVWTKARTKWSFPKEFFGETEFILGGPTNLLLQHRTPKMSSVTSHSHSLKILCLEPAGCRPKLQLKLRLKVLL